jgi:hypothetical protein
VKPVDGQKLLCSAPLDIWVAKNKASIEINKIIELLIVNPLAIFLG